MAELKLVGTIALKGVLGEFEREFQAKTGAVMSYTWGPTGTVYQCCRTGEDHDVLIAVPDAIDTMIAEGHAQPNSRVDVAKSVIGIAVKAGAPQPRIDTVEDVREALRAATAVSYTDPATQAASGLHVQRLLADWGLSEDVNRKTVFGRGGPVAEFLLSGEAEIAIQQLCEHLLVEGVDVVGPLPAEIQRVSTMSVGLGARGRNRAAAQHLIDWLSSPAVHAILRRHGLFPLDEI